LAGVERVQVSARLVDPSQRVEVATAVQDDSKGRERLESKADLAGRGVESPDRADALIGAIMLGIGSDPYALNPVAKQTMHAAMDRTLARMERSRSPFYEPHVDFSQW
jgi:hypothetical protein